MWQVSLFVFCWVLKKKNLEIKELHLWQESDTQTHMILLSAPISFSFFLSSWDNPTSTQHLSPCSLLFCCKKMVGEGAHMALVFHPQVRKWLERRLQVKDTQLRFGPRAQTAILQHDIARKAGKTFNTIQVRDRRFYWYSWDLFSFLNIVQSSYLYLKKKAKPVIKLNYFWNPFPPFQFTIGGKCHFAILPLAQNFL